MVWMIEWWGKERVGKEANSLSEMAEGEGC